MNIWTKLSRSFISIIKLHSTSGFPSKLRLSLNKCEALIQSSPCNIHRMKSVWTRTSSPKQNDRMVPWSICHIGRLWISNSRIWCIRCPMSVVCNRLFPLNKKKKKMLLYWIVKHWWMHNFYGNWKLAFNILPTVQAEQIWIRFSNHSTKHRCVGNDIDHFIDWLNKRRH